VSLRDASLECPASRPIASDEVFFHRTFESWAFHTSEVMHRCQAENCFQNVFTFSFSRASEYSEGSSRRIIPKLGGPDAAV